MLNLQEKEPNIGKDEKINKKRERDCKFTRKGDAEFRDAYCGKTVV